MDKGRDRSMLLEGLLPAWAVQVVATTQASCQALTQQQQEEEERVLQVYREQ
jgi:hypothetical protein